MKKIYKKKTEYPPNVKEVPDNIKHLLNDGDLEFVVPPDGACAPHCGAAHIFKNTVGGLTFRQFMNNHMVDCWHFYEKNPAKRGLP